MFEYFCEQRRPRRGRLAKEQVEKLPSRKYKKGTWAVSINLSPWHLHLSAIYRSHVSQRILLMPDCGLYVNNLKHVVESLWHMFISVLLATLWASCTQSGKRSVLPLSLLFSSCQLLHSVHKSAIKSYLECFFKVHSSITKRLSSSLFLIQSLRNAEYEIEPYVQRKTRCSPWLLRLLSFPETRD